METTLQLIPIEQEFGSGNYKFTATEAEIFLHKITPKLYNGDFLGLFIEDLEKDTVVTPAYWILEMYFTGDPITSMDARIEMLDNTEGESLWAMIEGGEENYAMRPFFTGNIDASGYVSDADLILTYITILPN